MLECFNRGIDPARKINNQVKLRLPHVIDQAELYTKRSFKGLKAGFIGSIGSIRSIVYF